MNQTCNALGDCGTSINYIGINGYQTKAAITREDVEEGDDSGGGLFG